MDLVFLGVPPLKECSVELVGEINSKVIPDGCILIIVQDRTSADSLQICFSYGDSHNTADPFIP